MTQENKRPPPLTRLFSGLADLSGFSALKQGWRQLKWRGEQEDPWNTRINRAIADIHWEAFRGRIPEYEADRRIDELKQERQRRRAAFSSPVPPASE